MRGATSPVVETLRNPRFTGAPFMHVWTPEDYDGAPVCNTILQHPTTGLIYVAQNTGVLEFDGTRWRSFRGGKGIIESLTVDRAGRVWFAGYSGVGVLQPDAQAELQVASVAHRFTGNQRISGTSGVIAAHGGVYYAAGSWVHFLRDDDDSPATSRSAACGWRRSGD